MRFTGTFMILLAMGLLLACSARPGQLQANVQAPQSGANNSTSIFSEADRTRMSEIIRESSVTHPSISALIESIFLCRM